MLLSCDQKALSEALATVSKAVNLNNTLPVLNNILLKAENKKLLLAGTNLEIAITTTIPAEVKNEGALTVPARLFTSFVSLLPAGKIELSKDSLEMTVKAAKSQTKIKGISADEFPLIPQVKKENSLKIPVNDLIEAINQVAFSAAKDMVRPVLAGVNLLASKDGIRFAATDSYRLSEKKLKGAADAPANLIIPTRTLLELVRILEKGKETVELDISANQVLFLYKEVELASRLIEGAFPDYSPIIPKSHKTQLQISTDELAQVVKRVNLFMKDSSAVRLEITADQKMFISSGATQIGQEQAEVGATVAGDANEVALNPGYLLDALNALGSKEVLMEVTDKNAPVVLRASKDASYLHLIMPLKI